MFTSEKIHAKVKSLLMKFKFLQLLEPDERRYE